MAVIVALVGNQRAGRREAVRHFGGREAQFYSLIVKKTGS
jgi:hypothetical protein